MDHEVPVDRVSAGRGTMSAVLVVLAAVAVVGAAVATKGASAPSSISPVLVPPSAAATESTGRPSRSTPVGGAPSSPTAPTLVLAGPGGNESFAVDCSGFELPACLRLATEAVRALPTRPPTIRGLLVSPSLVCASALDCPREFLRRAVVVASVTVRFDGSHVLLDVVGRPEGLGSDRPNIVYHAWIVHERGNASRRAAISRR